LKYNAAKPVNYSPNNTGVNILLPAKPSSLWNNDNGVGDPIPGLSGGGDFPQPKLATPPAQSFGMVPSVTAPPWTSFGSKAYEQDMEYGAGDGALYVLDYGSSSYSDIDDDGFYRISYTGCLPAVSLAGGGLERSHVALQAGHERLAGPAGAAILTAYDLSGKRIWSAAVPSGNTYITLPENLRGMFRIIWR